MPRTTHVLLALAAMAAPGLAAAAETSKVHILAPWESAGQLFRTGPETVLFLGTAEGIMYIENGKGALDAATFTCPGTREMSAKTGASMGHGSCIMTGAGGDQVFASYKCEGGAGACEGEFKLTGGTGKFTGITGGGKMMVRTALSGMAANVKSGTVVSGAAGLAIWPELEYSIP